MFGQYKEGVTIKWLIKEDFQIDLIKNKTKYFSYFPFTKRDSITFLLLSILCANHRYFQQSNIQAIHWWVFLVLIHSLIHEYCKDQNVALSFILKGSVIDETNLLFWWTTTTKFYFENSSNTIQEWIKLSNSFIFQTSEFICRDRPSSLLCVHQGGNEYKQQLSYRWKKRVGGGRYR